jgi:polysaccharide export outer membrane protein
MISDRIAARVAGLFLIACVVALANGCGTPYYVEGQDELGDLPDSLRVMIEERERETVRDVQTDEGVFVRELEAEGEAEGEQVPPLPLEYSSEGPYLLRRGDKVLVTVMFYPELETTTIVRPDGMITAPGVGDVAALGRRPEEVAADIEAHYSKMLRDPTTTLNVVAFGERRAYVLGQVLKPGPIDLQQRLTLTQALAATGSPTRDAKLGSVILLRRKTENTAQAYRLDLSGVLEGKSLAADVVLQPEDLVYVPSTFVSNLEYFVRQTFDGLIPIPDMIIRSYDAIHVDERAAIRRDVESATSTSN